MGLLSALRTKQRRETTTRVRGGAPRRLPATVDRREQVADRAILLHLRLDAADAPAATAPGAHVDLHLSNGLVRQYSLVNAGRGDALLSICVQREDAGRGGSLHAHETLRVGEQVHVSEPRNTFALLPATAPVLLLAGGVGITPLVSMAAALHDAGAPFELHAYAASAPSLPLAEHLLASDYAASVTLHFSAEGDSFRAQGPDLLQRPQDGGAIYVCGPDAFVALARERALAAGWRADQIATERFGADGLAPTGADSAFTVVAASTGQRMLVSATESIAEVLERNGYETFRSCGQGFCGSCITPVVRGIPDHRDAFQSEFEHASNAQINVCCSRSLTPELELDV